MRLLHSIIRIVFYFYFLHSTSSNFNSTSSSSSTYTKLVKVSTSLGNVVGRSIDGINYYLGIPFAEPPVGRYRFHPPAHKKPWFPSTYQAFDFSPECLQSVLQSPDGGPKDEDCLYLNIWQPSNIEKNVLLPVLVWIYGGGFLHGSASRPYYWGDKIAKQNVIVVSFNYRVGALGFLVSTNDGLFGNYGLHDQKLALEWVQDNIRHFHGDPNRVTLFGESAGAMSIGLHFLEQQYHIQQSRRIRKKLFNQIVLQSNPLGYKYRTVAVANFIGEAYKEQLDCEDLRCLQSEPVDELIHVQDTLMAVPRAIGDFFTWGPTVTDNSYYRESRLRSAALSDIIVHQPLEALKNLKNFHFPVILGANADEGTLFVYSAYPGRMVKVVFQTVVLSFFRTSAPAVLRTYESLIQSIDRSLFPDYRIALSTIIGDYLFRCPNQLFANILSNPPVSTKVYLYEFALPTRTPGAAYCDGLSCHTAEIPYVFHLQDMIVNEYMWKHQDIVRSILSPSFGHSSGSSGGSGSGSASLASDAVQSQSQQSYMKQQKQNMPADPSSRSSSNSNSNSNNNSNNNRGTHSSDTTTAPATSTHPAVTGTTASTAATRIDYKDRTVRTHLAVSDYMVKYWTNFACYGDPNGRRTNQTNHGYATNYLYYSHTAATAATATATATGDTRTDSSYSSSWSSVYQQGQHQRLLLLPRWPTLLGDQTVRINSAYTTTGTTTTSHTSRKASLNQFESKGQQQQRKFHGFVHNNPTHQSQSRSQSEHIRRSDRTATSTAAAAASSSAALYKRNNFLSSLPHIFVSTADDDDDDEGVDGDSDDEALLGLAPLTDSESSDAPLGGTGRRSGSGSGNRRSHPAEVFVIDTAATDNGSQGNDNSYDSDSDRSIGSGGFRIDWHGFRQGGIQFLQQPFRRLQGAILDHQQHQRQQQQRRRSRELNGDDDFMSGSSDSEVIDSGSGSGGGYRPLPQQRQQREARPTHSQSQRHQTSGHSHRSRYDEYGDMTSDDDDDDDNRSSNSINHGSGSDRGTSTRHQPKQPHTPPSQQQQQQQQQYENDIYIMVFDEVTQVGIVSSASDCICRFWNSLDYQF